MSEVSGPVSISHSSRPFKMNSARSSTLGAIASCSGIKHLLLVRAEQRHSFDLRGCRERQRAPLALHDIQAARQRVRRPAVPDRVLVPLRVGELVSVRARPRPRVARTPGEHHRTILTPRRLDRLDRRRQELRHDRHRFLDTPTRLRHQRIEDELARRLRVVAERRLSHGHHHPRAREALCRLRTLPLAP
ncbi:hypothetical protein ACFPRL_31805 [Pseudoclavibacter helvolus]